MKDETNPIVDKETAARIARQSSLAPAPNPAPQLDYLCRLTGVLDHGAGMLEISIAYVPDRGLLTDTAFNAYLAQLAGAVETVEGLAVIVTDDLNNELVPRWVQVGIRRAGRREGETPETDGATEAAVLVEDRQPNWSNPELLGRLRAF